MSEVGRVHHKSASDGAVRHTPARHLDRLASIGREPLGQIMPPPPLPLASLARRCFPGPASHGGADGDARAAGSR